MITYDGNCGQCGKGGDVCWNCHSCTKHCRCPSRDAQFDADELGLDPESDNTPEDSTRHA